MPTGSGAVNAGFLKRELQFSAPAFIDLTGRRSLQPFLKRERTDEASQPKPAGGHLYAT